MKSLLFKKKAPKVIDVNGSKIELQPKPKKGLGSLFSPRPKAKPAQNPQAPIQGEDSVAPIPVPPSLQQEQQELAQAQDATPQRQQQNSDTSEEYKQLQLAIKRAAGQKLEKEALKKQNAWVKHIEKLAIKNRKVEIALRQQGIKESLYDFIQRMFIASIMISIVVGIAIFLVLSRTTIALPIAVIFAVMLAFVINQFAFKSFMNYPLRRSEVASKNIERDILFASRDMIISLRSGMPLYNAIASISTGYGDASKEFAKITERVQLGQPLEEAIDQTIADTKSASFRRLMLQASVSIKAGADVVSALQTMIDQLAQERIIDLRRYGQRLNAIAMFYMLFGVILPSMGIAVLTILTTFVPIFTVTGSLLTAGIVGIVFLQIVFLQIIRSSRPVFAQ